MVTILGAVILWAGYQVFTFGYTQIRGCNIGVTDLAWPGRTIACNPDGGGPSAGAGGAPLAPGNYSVPNIKGGYPSQPLTGLPDLSGLAKLSPADRAKLIAGINNLPANSPAPGPTFAPLPSG